MLGVLEEAERAVDSEQVIDERNRRNDQNKVLDDDENLYTSGAADAPVSWPDERKSIPCRHAPGRMKSFRFGKWGMRETLLAPREILA
jgi:hypothetical protein